METNLSGNVDIDAERFPMTSRLYSYWAGLPSAPTRTWSDVDLMKNY